MIHVRHAAAAIASGMCKTVLITHGDSGRSGVGRTRNFTAPTSLAGQFEQPYGPMGPPTLFTIPVLRYMKTYGLTHEQLAMVSVVQREWAAKNPRATLKTPITVEDVLNSRMIAYPFRLLQCCLVTDDGGALILVAPERAPKPATCLTPARGSGLHRVSRDRSRKVNDRFGSAAEIQIEAHPRWRYRYPSRSPYQGHEH
jgi:acetyl-CoA acetyltransferase